MHLFCRLQIFIRHFRFGTEWNYHVRSDKSERDSVLPSQQKNISCSKADCSDLKYSF